MTHQIKTAWKRFSFEIVCMMIIFACGVFTIQNSHDFTSPVHAQSSAQTPCILTGQLIATGQSIQLDNRYLGCYQFRVSYNSVGFTAISIQLEFAPDNGGVPGTWVAFSGSAVTDGTNPSVSTTGQIIGVHANAPWLRLNLVTAAGSGKLTYQVWGANSTQNIASLKGATGSQGATGATGPPGVTGMVQVGSVMAMLTTSVSSTNIFTSASGNHSYFAAISIYCSAVTATATATYLITYTDISGTVQTFAPSTVAACTTLGAASHGANAAVNAYLILAPSSTMSYTTTVVNGPAPYSFAAQIYQLN